MKKYSKLFAIVLAVAMILPGISQVALAVEVEKSEELLNDSEAAKIVGDMIKYELPLPKDIKLEDKDLIEEIRSAYDALSDKAKELVRNYELLELAEEALAELEDESESEFEIKNAINAQELTVESVEVLANKVAFVNFNRELLEDEVKEEDFKISANGESLEITSFYANPTNIALGFLEIERTDEIQTIVVEVEFNGKTIKSDPFEIKPKILKITDIIGVFEDIEVEFAGEYKLPEDVEVRLSNGEMIFVPIRWKDTVNVNKSGTYELEGNLYVSDLENIATTSRVVKVNVIVAEELEDTLSEDEKAAAEVDKLISRFRRAETDISEEYISRVEAAREGYDKLSEDAKDLVIDSNVKKLVEAEKKIKDYKDKTAAYEAEEVVKMIKSLPWAKNVTLEDKEDIEAARAAYEALSDKAKKLVTNIKNLENREEKIDKLEKEAVGRKQKQRRNQGRNKGLKHWQDRIR